jgi:UDP-N-acetyl-D-mannosaminuronic acid dehydrogenase
VLAERGRSVEDSRFAVLGYAYLENSDDSRNSPTATMLDELRRLGAEHVQIHDPFVDGFQGDVVDSGHTLIGAVRATVDTLSRAGTHILGTVLNKTKRGRGDSDYGYYSYGVDQQANA